MGGRTVPELKVGADGAVYYEHLPPAAPAGVTFVFFNALTGDLGMWCGEIGAALEAAGHGLLVFNYRGQDKSVWSPGERLDADLIVGDAVALLRDTAPVRPVFVGLSIGGLFAAHAVLGGAAAGGLVLINTLRRDSERLRWINDAVVRAAEFGGLQLFQDLYAPLIFNLDWQAANREAFLTHQPYEPISRASGVYNLLLHGGSADWDIAYEKLALPVLVVSGLQDRVFFDAADVAELAARMPDARRLDMPDAGHMVPAERPAELAAALLDFARSVARTEGAGRAA